jgi:phosphoribosylglycinamide formyltransferase-1
VSPPRVLGVLASHAGTTLQAILDAIDSGRLPLRMGIVISNNSGSTALERARRVGVETLHLSSATHADSEALDRAIATALSDAGVELVFLAGYMKRLGEVTLGRYRGRVLNTHPALLPKFGGQGMYGDNVHRAVLAARERVTGATIHLVDGEYDTGASLAQVEVAVEPDDTVSSLAARVQQSERGLVVSVLERIARGEIVLPNRSE